MNEQSESLNVSVAGGLLMYAINRSKFEITSFITKTIIPFLLGGGVIYAILQIVK